MIGYAITEADLLARISATASTWLARAGDRTSGFRAVRAYDEEATACIWSEIKPVYMALQHNKCGYCERRLEGPPYGFIEHDIEHFRPKRGVTPWPDARALEERRIRYRFTTGEALPRGYYLLAYAPLNYVVACKTCNTILKKTFFPIAGKRRRLPSVEVSRHASEEAFLIYPLGDIDDDPEEIITFDALTPIPRYRSGMKRRRAVVTIDLLALDTREELLRGRAERIVWLYMAREKPTDPVYVRTVGELLSPASPHANCTRAFASLCDRDPARARAIVELADGYLESHSP